MRVAIRVENLSKVYRIQGHAADEGRPSVLQTITSLAARPLSHLRTSLRAPTAAQELWALRDVSFEVPAGQLVGVIGANGSGKSTLLKILSRITAPTSGAAELHGRVASLLEVGTGFHPELTGRENVFLNGVILGMSRRDVARLFDEIVSFAGEAVERMIDTPVKRYSSGMQVRLGFAVAAHLDPDVLLVDEVLAVGDAAFRERCMGRMDSARREGRAVLLVSHGLETIEQLAETAIWLDRGVLRARGEARGVVKTYLSTAHSLARTGLDRATPEDRPLWFTGFEVLDQLGASVSGVPIGAPLRFVLHYRARGGTTPRRVAANIVVREPSGREVTRFWTPHQDVFFPEVPLEGRIVCDVPRLTLAPGSYRLDLDTSVDGVLSDWVLAGGKLDVLDGDFFGRGGARHSFGLFACDHTWAVHGPAPSPADPAAPARLACAAPPPP